MRNSVRLLCFLLLASSACLAQINKQHFYEKGRNDLIKKNYLNAIESFNILTQADPSLYDAYFFKAIAKYNLGDFIGAQADFTKAVEFNPVFTFAYHYRAIVRTNLGLFQEAMRDLEQALALRPQQPSIFFSRGIVHFFMQQFPEALTDFNAYLRYEPKDGDVYIKRGTTRLFLKDTVRAYEDYNTAIQLNRRDPEAFLRRGRLYAAQSDWTKATADFDVCLRLDSTNTLAYYSRALTRYETKDFKGAMADFDKVIALEPNNALTYYNRALIRSQIGDLDLALKDYEKVIQINPNNILVYFNRAGLWMEKNRPREAIADYSSAIELYPDFASAYLNRSLAKKQLKNLKGAEADYKIAQEKIKTHRNKLQDSTNAYFADTSRQFNALIALDADFGSKIFNNEMSSNNAIELQTMARLVIGIPENTRPLTAQYIHIPYEQYRQTIAPLEASIRFDFSLLQDSTQLDSLANAYMAHHTRSGLGYFMKALLLHKQGQYTSAQEYYKQALKIEPGNIYFRMNSAVSKSEMIDFISSIDNNFQNVVLDENSSISTRNPSKKNLTQYSYEEASQEISQAIRIEPDFAPLYYNKGVIDCNSGKMIEGIAGFTKAIELDPQMAEAYYNRGLVQIYLKDTEKGCLDISKSGELGMRSAYSILKQYCKRKP